MAGQTVIVSVLADTARFNTAMRGTDTALSRFASSLTNVSRVGSIAFATVTYAVGRFVIASVKAAEEAEAIDRKLINQASNIQALSDSYKEVSARLIGVAEVQQRLLGIDDDLIKATQTILLTFEPLAKLAGEVGGAFDRTTEAAFNLAELGFGSAEDNAKALGKALSNPVDGLGSLTRLGVIFTQQQKDQIANFVATGEAAKAYSVILDAIEVQSAKAGIVGVTATQKLTTAWDNFQEAFGKRILPALTPSIDKLTVALYDLADSPEFAEFAKALAQAFQDIVETKALPKLVKGISDFLKLLKENDKTLLDVLLFFNGITIALAVLSPLLTIVASGWALLERSIGRSAALKAAKNTIDDLNYGLPEMGLGFDRNQKNIEKWEKQLKDGTKTSVAFVAKLNEAKENSKLWAAEMKTMENRLSAANSEVTKLTGVFGRLRNFLFGTDEALGLLTGGWANFGRNVLGAVRALGKFFLIGYAIEFVIGLVRGVIEEFNEKMKENPQFAQAMTNAWNGLLATFQGILNISNGIGDFIQNLGRWVGKFLIDPMETVVELWQEFLRLIGQWGKVRNNYTAPTTGSNYYGVTPPTYTPYSAPRTSSMTPTVYNVNVNALTPSPEVGRVVVKAISDFERTGGAR